MLIAALTTLLIVFGSGSADVTGVKWTIAQLQAIVSDHVTDEARLTEIQSLLSEMAAEAEGFEERTYELRRRLIETDGDYQATAADFRAVFRDIEANWRETEQRLLDLRFRLRDLTTRAEWVAMFDQLRKQLGDD